MGLTQFPELSSAHLPLNARLFRQGWSTAANGVTINGLVCSFFRSYPWISKFLYFFSYIDERCSKECTLVLSNIVPLKEKWLSPSQLGSWIERQPAD